MTVTGWCADAVWPAMRLDCNACLG